MNGIIVGVEEIERARARLAASMNDELYSRILLFKFKFSIVKICVVVVYVREMLKKGRGSETN